MCKNHDSPNHAYILATVQRLAGPRPKVLDYGCGTGAFVAAARAAGLDAWGVDTYAGPYAHWRAALLPGVRPYVRELHGATPRLPWPDGSFDAVAANQVFEHMAWHDVAAAVSEVARVLRPGGVFLALFPTADVWWEGHFGVYFLHRLARWPRIMRLYLAACGRLGIGYHRAGMSAQQWASEVAGRWPYDIRHHEMDDVAALWRRAFGSNPTCLAADYMRYRLPWARALPAPILAFVCHKRAGRVLIVRQADARAATAYPQPPECRTCRAHTP